MLALSLVRYAALFAVVVDYTLTIKTLEENACNNHAFNSEEKWNALVKLVGWSLIITTVHLVGSVAYGKIV